MSGLWASGDVLSLARLNQKTVYIGTSAPTSTYAGQIWFDSTSDIFKVRDSVNDSNWAFVPSYKVIVAQATADNVNAVNSEAAFTHCVYTFAANALQAGQVIILEAWGYQASSGTATNPRIILRWGAAGSGTILLDTGVTSGVNNLVNAQLYIRCCITVITIGSSGTVWCQGIIMWQHNSLPVLRGLGTAGTGCGNGATVTINTTVQTTLTLSALFSNTTAGNTLTITNCTLLI